MSRSKMSQDYLLEDYTYIEGSQQTVNSWTDVALEIVKGPWAPYALMGVFILVLVWLFLTKRKDIKNKNERASFRSKLDEIYSIITGKDPDGFYYSYRDPNDKAITLANSEKLNKILEKLNIAIGMKQAKKEKKKAKGK